MISISNPKTLIRANAGIFHPSPFTILLNLDCVRLYPDILLL